MIAITDLLLYFYILAKIFFFFFFYSLFSLFVFLLGFKIVLIHKKCALMLEKDN